MEKDTLPAKLVAARRHWEDMLKAWEDAENWRDAVLEEFEKAQAMLEATKRHAHLAAAEWVRVSNAITEEELK